MSAVDTVKGIQRLLGVAVDGYAGPKTEAAWVALKAAAVQEHSGAIANAVDARSEANIKTLHPRVQPLARKLVTEAAADGITIVITSGTRTYEEQDALYEQGRTKPGNIVTNARGGYSSHNFGTAFDFTVFKGGKPVWEGIEYKAVGNLGKAIGLSWGGDWSSPDEPHLYLKPDWAKDFSEAQMMTGLRDRHSNGQDAFA